MRVRHRRVKTGTFIAKDELGNTYRLHTFVEKIPVTTLRGPYEEIDGMKSILDDNGEPVNFLEKGKYKIVATDVIVTSSDPNCPG